MSVREIAKLSRIRPRSLSLCCSFTSSSQKTYQLITACHPDTAAWTSSGTTFCIKDVDAFSKEEIPRFFKHNNMSSFVRQLNCYGFHKVKSNAAYQEFHHPHFQRGRVDLLNRIHKTDKVDFASKQEVDDLRTEVSDLKQLIVQMSEQMKQMHIMCQTAIAATTRKEEDVEDEDEEDMEEQTESSGKRDNGEHHQAPARSSNSCGSRSVVMGEFGNFHLLKDENDGDDDDADEELYNRSFQSSMAGHSRGTSISSSMSMSVIDPNDLLSNFNIPQFRQDGDDDDGDNVSELDDATANGDDIIDNDQENETTVVTTPPTQEEEQPQTHDNLLSGVDILEPIPEVKVVR